VAAAAAAAGEVEVEVVNHRLTTCFIVAPNCEMTAAGAAVEAAAAGSAGSAVGSMQPVASAAWQQGQTHRTRFITGWHVTQETRVDNALDNVAMNICEAYACRTNLVLARGGLKLS
jgi:hypothetical protein